MGGHHALFDIRVEHGFFPDALCRGLDFVPTRKTSRMMANAGVLLHKQPDGIALSYDDERLEALQLYGADGDEPLSFDFNVYADDPQFRSYTEPFGADRNVVAYFDNREAGDDSGERIRLHRTDYVSNIDLITPDSPRLKDMLSQKERLIPPVFVVRIFAHDGQGSAIDRWCSAAVTQYRIAFQSRETFWTYYLLGGVATPAAHIVDPDGRVEFEALGKTTIGEGREAFAFRSQQTIPLRQRYDFRFQLKAKSQEGERVLIKQLPVACVSRAGKEVVAEQGIVVSEIYVNS